MLAMALLAGILLIWTESDYAMYLSIIIFYVGALLIFILSIECPRYLFEPLLDSQASKKVSKISHVIINVLLLLQLLAIVFAAAYIKILRLPAHEILWCPFLVFIEDLFIFSYIVIIVPLLGWNLTFPAYLHTVYHFIPNLLNGKIGKKKS